MFSKKKAASAEDKTPPIDLAREVLKLRQEQPERLAQKARDQETKIKRLEKADKRVVKRVFECSIDTLANTVRATVDRKFESKIIPALLKSIESHLDTTANAKKGETSEPGDFYIGYLDTVTASSSYSFVGGGDSWPTAVVIHSFLTDKDCQKPLLQLLEAFDTQQFPKAQRAITLFAHAFSAEFGRSCEAYTEHPHRTFTNIWRFDPEQVKLSVKGLRNGAEFTVSFANEYDTPLKGVFALLCLSEIRHRLCERGLKSLPSSFDIQNYSSSGPGLYDSTDEGITTSGGFLLSLS